MPTTSNELLAGRRRVCAQTDGIEFYQVLDDWLTTLPPLDQADVNERFMIDWDDVHLEEYVEGSCDRVRTTLRIYVVGEDRTTFLPDVIFAVFDSALEWRQHPNETLRLLLVPPGYEHVLEVCRTDSAVLRELLGWSTAYQTQLNLLQLLAVVGEKVMAYMNADLT